MARNVLKCLRSSSRIINPSRRNKNGAQSFSSKVIVFLYRQLKIKGAVLNSIIWIVGAVVIVLAALSFFGLR
ncbi:hypothetical protein EN925_23650 [Mesorhizobium sp. M7A.F.Ca.US.006.04.2.1]|nr:hypothetical protein EN990_26715 [Mesorhizobium sp. M7A.F.Ca.US.005.03.1.1]RUY12771.1 hypothetical protein EN991_22855 [Mesorhizobium sp. M7A.F.Ca.US.005.03.2.1]RUY21776.1 hypothetical protein EN979_33675 [Mesorhizobium sp. M7A.F.Ca.US.001.04.2.1]RUY35001.1 hypothetical protein EN978_33445 [Mesorhizobium sp. M7A.F.Ca.US.001.04.1.1]RUY92454.1 hypothetical protein EN974_26645 [Mesorhizobium sp. M7A.F.Ca.CA.001.12.2.1]RUZ22834.1 hypothetical protein EN949_18860 [Mesorhizobium sp. M7A.F.Ca.US.0